VILTGGQLRTEVEAGRIVIDPIDWRCIEPNSYGFRLGPELICYEDRVIDASQEPTQRRWTIPPDGATLEPGRLYLCSTLETMGSDHYAAMLYARRSVSTLGIWIQFSAPLGHTGAIIPWTLEIRVAAPVVVYSEMRIGKIAFWKTLGEGTSYRGKYSSSRTVVGSRLHQELWTKRASA
jgi:dCTP deaminase